MTRADVIEGVSEREGLIARLRARAARELADAKAIAEDEERCGTTAIGVGEECGMRWAARVLAEEADLLALTVPTRDEARDEAAFGLALMNEHVDELRAEIDGERAAAIEECARELEAYAEDYGGGEYAAGVRSASRRLRALAAAPRQPRDEPAATPSAVERAESGASLIARERKRQTEKEGWTREHDGEHDKGDLAVIAAGLAVYDTDAKVDDPMGRIDGRDDFWGLTRKHKGDEVRRLVIAGALIAAEIDRVLRAKGGA